MSPLGIVLLGRAKKVRKNEGDPKRRKETHLFHDEERNWGFGNGAYSRVKEQGGIVRSVKRSSKLHQRSSRALVNNSFGEEIVPNRSLRKHPKTRVFIIQEKQPSGMGGGRDSA